MMQVLPADLMAIDLIVGNMHVATSDEDVEADIRRRIDPNMGRPTGYPDALVAAAIEAHHANRDTFSRIVTGRV